MLYQMMANILILEMSKWLFVSGAILRVPDGKYFDYIYANLNMKKYFIQNKRGRVYFFVMIFKPFKLAS